MKDAARYAAYVQKADATLAGREAKGSRSIAFRING
jgi:hypothetical protein